MSSPLTGSATYQNNFLVPSFGELGANYPGIVSNAFQKCLNNDEYLAIGLTPILSGGVIPLGPVNGIDVQLQRGVQLSSLIVSGTADFNADTNFFSTVTLYGQTTVTNVVNPASDGRFIKRLKTMTDANLTVGWGTAGFDIVYMPLGIQTAVRTLTLSDTGAANGAVMSVTNSGSSWTLIVKESHFGSTIITLSPLQGASFVYVTALGTWTLLQKGT